MANATDSPFADAAESPANLPRSLRRPSGDRWLAVLLIGIQLFVLADLAGARAFPVIMVCVALWGLVTRVRLRIEPTARNLTYAILAIGFLLHYMFAPYPLPLDSQFVYSSLAHSVARLLISLQVVQLYLQHREGRLPIWIAGCGAAALCFATDVSVPGFAHQRLMGIMAVFMAAFALYGSRSRRIVGTATGAGGTRALLLSVALLAVLCFGTGAIWALQKHERSIEWFLSEHFGYSGRTLRAGFSPNGQLQSVTQWKTDGGDRIMLRIFAESAPEYLRGKAFDTYHGFSRETSSTAWEATTLPHPLPDAQIGRNLPRVRSGDRLYELSSTPPADSRMLDVWPEEGTVARIFTPLGATRLGINGVDLKIDAHDIVTINDRSVRINDRSDALPYMVFAPETAGARATDASDSLPVEYHQLLTALEGPIDEEVRTLAADLFAECRTTRQTLDAVRRYFHEHYTYKLGIDVPRQMDPVTYFLTEQPPAHCEYFATGTAVLLRLAGVPCRYVVGYVSRERNAVGGFWVARNKDAHAWVEAFDEDQGGWVIVESTPSVGVPQPREQDFASQVSDSFRHRLSIVRIRIRKYGLVGLLLAVAQFVWSIPGLIVLLGIFVALLARYRPKTFAFRSRERQPAHLKGLHAALALLDRRTREHGWVRPPEETLTRFATRLREPHLDADWGSATADCYALYVELRYQGQTGRDAVQRFRQAITTIPPSPKRTVKG